MRRPWFRPWGWFHRPVTWPGAVVWTVAGLFCAVVVVAVGRRSASASDTFFGVFPYVLPTLLAVDWIAVRTGAGPER